MINWIAEKFLKISRAQDEFGTIIIRISMYKIPNQLDVHYRTVCYKEANMSSCADRNHDCSTGRCQLHVDPKYISLTDRQLLELIYKGDNNAYDALVRQIFNRDVMFLRDCIRKILAESSTSNPDAEVVEELLHKTLATLWVQISDPNKRTVNPAKLKSHKLKWYLKKIAVRQTWEYKSKKAIEAKMYYSVAEIKQLRTDATTVIDSLVKDEDEEKFRCAWENEFGKKKYPALLQKVMKLAKEGLGCVKIGRELGIHRCKASHLKRKGIDILRKVMGGAYICFPDIGIFL